MKRIAVAVGLAGIVVVGGVFFWRTVKVHAMSVPINIKDFPEHGVRIIAASDPTFVRRAESFFEGQPQTIVDRVKPFSVLLENSGTLAIVGSTVKWEITKRDGTTFNQPVSSVNTRALMDGEPRSIQTTRGAAIPPNSIRFVSVLGSAGEGQRVDLSRSWIAFRGSPSEGEAFRRALADSNMDEAFNRSIIGKVLTEATSVTVSVDLVFFEDGTFVGDDKGDFFNKVKADMDAQYDLYTEVTVAQYEGKTLEEIFKRVGELAASHSQTRKSSPEIDSYSGKQKSEAPIESTKRRYSDEYDRSKTLYAQELIGMRGALGAKEAIAQKLQLLDKPRKLLRRRSTDK